MSGVFVYENLFFTFRRQSDHLCDILADKMLIQLDVVTYRNCIHIWNIADFWMLLSFLQIPSICNFHGDINEWQLNALRLYPLWKWVNEYKFLLNVRKGRRWWNFSETYLESSDGWNENFQLFEVEYQFMRWELSRLNENIGWGKMIGYKYTETQISIVIFIK